MNQENIQLENEILEEDTMNERYLSFNIQDEKYSVEIRYVTEIIGIQKIAPIPNTPKYIEGIINLRGNIIPVVNVRSRFGLDVIDYDDRTCIVVVGYDSNVIGLIVDSVSEVLIIKDANIDNAPQTNKGAKSIFLNGVGKLEDGVSLILNLESFLTENN